MHCGLSLFVVCYEDGADVTGPQYSQTDLWSPVGSRVKDYIAVSCNRRLGCEKSAIVVLADGSVISEDC